MPQLGSIMRHMREFVDWTRRERTSAPAASLAERDEGRLNRAKGLGPAVQHKDNLGEVENPLHISVVELAFTDTKPRYDVTTVEDRMGAYTEEKSCLVLR